jgi:D-alanyl-D-alanine carboxypeptidase
MEKTMNANSKRNLSVAIAAILSCSLVTINIAQANNTNPVPSDSDRALSKSKIDYSKVVPIQKNINRNLTSPSADYMKRVLGVPGRLTENCSSVTNDQLRNFIITKDVGPFSVTGVKPAVNAVARVMEKVKKDNPRLYSQLGSAGMLCVRKVRGGSEFSNHSWGTTIDLKINGKLDERGDGKTQLGLKKLYPYFHKEGFYWGAGFRTTEDAMHFEASKELVAKWKRTNKLP